MARQKAAGMLRAYIIANPLTRVLAALGRRARRRAIDRRDLVGMFGRWLRDDNRCNNDRNWKSPDGYDCGCGSDVGIGCETTDGGERKLVRVMTLVVAGIAWFVV